MAQIINMNTPAAAQKAAAEMTNKMQEASQERKSMFEALMNEIEKINPSLGGFEDSEDPQGKEFWNVPEVKSSPH